MPLRPLNLLATVVAKLDERGILCALIGAEALALRGVSRATADRDLLVTDLGALDAALWSSLNGEGAEVEIRRGEADDPLAGVVRFRAEGDRPVDLIVGRHEWQTRLLERSEILDLGDVRVAVPRSADLVLLKLFAGGPQDAWDIAQLLADEDRLSLVREIEGRIRELPEEARRLWQKILAG